MAGFTNLTPPTVSGARTVGGTVTADPGSWSPTPGGYVYQWERADSVAATTGTVISGATGSTYTIAPEDNTKYVRVGVYPTEPVGVAHRFGVSTGYPISYWSTAQRNAYYTAIRTAGFTRVRFDYVTAVPGALGDLHVQSAISAGLQVRIGIGGSTGDSAAAYASRCTTCVNYFKTWVSEYELMNEPNINGWASGSAYAVVAKAGSAAVRAAMPTAKVVLGGISSFGVHGQTAAGVPDIWLASVYTQGATWFDYVDFHPYGFGTSYTGLQAFQNPSGWAMIDWLRSVMVANGDTLKKIHIGEHGAPTFNPIDWPSGSTQSMSEQAQSDFLSLSITDLKSKDYLGDFYLYSFRDRYPDEHAGSREGHFGIILNTSATPGADTPKIAYSVVAGLIV